MRPSGEDDLLRMNSRMSARTSGRDDSSSSSRRPLRRWAFVSYLTVALIVGGMALQILRTALQPHCLIWLTEREIKRIELRQQDADREHQDLVWQSEYTRTEEGKKSLKRYFGFVKAGEIPIVVPGNCAPADPPNASQTVPPTLWERFMLLVCRLCGADPNNVG